jgi:hypothetical protein
MQNVPVFNPTSPEAKAISDLFFAVLVICGVILAIVTGVVAYSLVRSRARPGAGEPRQVFGSRPLEILWTGVPMLMLGWIFALTVRAMGVADPSATEPPDLTVIGHQWWWEVRYAKSPVVTANEIHVPAGQRLLVRVVGPPELGKPPDPSIIAADPRPDWYLLWYFAVLALLPHGMENWFKVGGPLLAGVVLLLLPILRNRACPRRSGIDRPGGSPPARAGHGQP